MIATTVVSSIALSAFMAGQMHGADARPAILSTPELQKRLAEAQSKLWAWEVEYESARADRFGVPTKSYVHRLVAARAPNRFFHWNAHGTASLGLGDDLLQQRMIVTSDEVYVDARLDRLFFKHKLRPDEALPGSAPRELWLVSTGWWPLTQRPSPTLGDKLPASLSAVAHSSAYKSRPNLEQVHERWCQVLEFPGRDQLWLDVDRGCAVAARQITYADQGGVQRFEFSDFRELLPGVWVPFTLRNIIYEQATKGGSGKVVHDATLSVLRVRLNDAVDEARFRFEPLPGSVGALDGQPLRQVVPGGEEYLDEVVEWIRRCSPTGGFATSQTGAGKWTDMVLGALIAGVMVTALAWRL